MKKKYLNLYLILLLAINFSGCQSLKDGLVGKKNVDSDQFLIEKKKPLTEPPEYNLLPEPNGVKKNNTEIINEYKIKDILNKSSVASQQSKKNSVVRKSILEKINKD
ncbi:DUF3035 domain-containing protein [Candidatus Pelagibacter sp.]|nr:DUF3035 domain-containing protein [Candidatus Pelagibacter sp.]